MSNVISFIPQTIIKNPIDPKYSDLKPAINSNTHYFLYGDKGVQNVNDNHHISHCENIEGFPNVEILKSDKCELKNIRDSGFIKAMIDNIIYAQNRLHT